MIVTGLDKIDEDEWVKLAGGHGKDFPCRWATTVECRLSECQSARRCRDEDKQTIADTICYGLKKRER